MTRRRKDDDDLKITVKIKYGERTPLWDHLWKCIILGLPFTENDRAKEESQETQEKKT